MNKLFIFIILTFTFVAAGCKKDDDQTTYPVPTKNETNIQGTKVIRTQVVTEGKKAVEITYIFNEQVVYNHQEWKIIFSTKSGATTAGNAAKLYYYSKPGINVSYSVNIVNINYPLGEGIGDEKLKAVQSLEAVKDVVQVAEILNILKLF